MSTQKDLPMAGIHDPKTYHAMSRPHADTEAAQQAIDAFIAETREVRVKHRVADVLMVVMVDVLHGEDEMGAVPVAQVCTLGDVRNAEFMAGLAVGATGRERAHRVAGAISNGREAGRKR